ncbi:hypothetical protein Bca52824_058231 [Brassica carinata]|uniref:Uncharacterized protein n=1 Tax=Brassica carinata TaxID=52824 RepID=A0A8X7UGY7_BRACI|nr:hypothetical protein Bca52824_058231 [Brassica carinata]
MALEKYGPHHPTIIESKHIKNLYELWGIDYTVGIEAPEDGENLETVRPGYCGAYTSHFQDGGLSFPLPRFLLEALTELGMAFAQMATNFWRYFLTSWIRAREEGLRFSLEELKKLFSIKRNNGFPGTMILAYRPSRSVIDDIPNRDNRWREKFFVFKINPASVGDFDFETIPRVWSDEIGRTLWFRAYDSELRGLIATLRRGSPRWLAFTVDRIRAAYTLPPGENRATPVGSVVPVRPGKGHRDKRAREKEVLPARSDESSEVGPVSIAVPVDGARRAPNASTGSVASSALRASGKGTSQVDDPSARLPDVQETSSWRFSYFNERDAYVRMAVANAKAMEASNEYAGLVEKHLADFSSKVEVGSHLLTIQQLRGNSSQGTQSCSSSLAQEYDAVLAVVKDKLWKKKEETTAEIRFEGGFELEEELGRLKDREISLDLDYGVASVSDPSLSRLDLPEVSGDLVDQE